MAKVQHRKAAKDYPDQGIKKGEMYYYTKIKTGAYSSREMRSKTPFKPSQLTSSEYLSRLYSWDENKAEISSMEDAQAFADEIRELGEEQQEKFDNMPDGLQQGDTGQMIEERANACENAASEIEDIIGEWESERDDFEGRDTDDEDYDPDEEFDESEFLDRVRDVQAE